VTAAKELHHKLRRLMVSLYDNVASTTSALETRAMILSYQARGIPTGFCRSTPVQALFGDSFSLTIAIDIGPRLQAATGLRTATWTCPPVQ